MDTGQTRWHVFFSGKVQRVGFRFTARCLARRLSLTGWVDNLPDGRVEMEAQGEVSQLCKLIERLRKQPRIRIEHVEIEEIPVRTAEGLPARRGLCARRPDGG